MYGSRMCVNINCPGRLGQTGVNWQRDINAKVRTRLLLNYGNIIAEYLFNPNSILFVDYDRLSHSGT